MRPARARDFYDDHRANRDPFDMDRVIRSLAVPLSATTGGSSSTRRTPPASDRPAQRRRRPRTRRSEPPSPRVLASCAERVLETAARTATGGWSSAPGAARVQNDPSQVAGAFHALLTDGGRFSGSFEHVVFGVLDRTRGAVVRSAFERAFTGVGIDRTASAQRQP